jgi:hypothetical protein
MPAPASARKIRLLVLWCARLALLAYVFQTAALDHWHPDPSSVFGYEGSSLHAVHCHSSAADCADSASLSGSLTQATLTPVAPSAFNYDIPSETVAVVGSSASAPDEPPRAA